MLFNSPCGIGLDKNGTVIFSDLLCLHVHVYAELEYALHVVMPCLCSQVIGLGLNSILSDIEHPSYTPLPQEIQWLSW